MGLMSHKPGSGASVRNALVCRHLQQRRMPNETRGPPCRPRTDHLEKTMKCHRGEVAAARAMEMVFCTPTCERAGGVQPVSLGRMRFMAARSPAATTWASNTGRAKIFSRGICRLQRPRPAWLQMKGRVSWRWGSEKRGRGSHDDAKAGNAPRASRTAGVASGGAEGERHLAPAVDGSPFRGRVRKAAQDGRKTRRETFPLPWSPR
jgi:hypothetical protein